MRFSRQEYCSGLPCLPLGNLPDPGLNPRILCPLHWQVGSLPLVPPQFSSLTHLCPTLCDPRTAARQASLSITSSKSLFKLMSIESVMPSNHLILCHPLLLLPSIFPSIRVFSSELILCIGWPKYWNFSFSISPSNEQSGLISFRMDWLGLFAVQAFLKSFLQHQEIVSSK